MPASDLSRTALTARVLLAPYLLSVALIVWLPASMASRVTGVAYQLARFASENFGVSLSTSYAVFEFLSNIALFVPFGILASMAWPQINRWLIILIGYASSATIELVQSLLPSRFPTLSDVIANTLGTVVGCLIVLLASRWFLKRRSSLRE